MRAELDIHGQPVGFALPGWMPPRLPTRAPLTGRYCRLDPLEPGVHAAALFEALSQNATGASWTYLPYGPFDSFRAFWGWLEKASAGSDPLFFVVTEAVRGQPVGLVSFMRIFPEHGTIELGHIHFSPLLRNSAAATEAIYLMLRAVFGLGYRRCEWKCDSLNQPSRKAAERFGFLYEGLFRQAMIYKGRNRDTAWYSILDHEWPDLAVAHEQWLNPANFDSDGSQKTRLSERIKLVASRR